ncbi:MAG: hypothetical protein WCF18_22910 [Chthoniobacteraceae bacterium]
MVIDESSVLALVDLLNGEWPKKREKDWGTSYDLRVRYLDGSEVRFDNPPKKLATSFDKPVISLGIDVRIRNASSSKRIAVALAHGSFPSVYTNVFDITGDDESWVNDIYARSESWIAALPRQFSMFRRWTGVLTNALAIPFGFLISKVVVWIMLLLGTIKTTSESQSLTPMVIVTYAAFVWLFGSIPAQICIWKLRDLWPPIELNIGPNHHLPHLAKRRKWNIFALVVILPVLGNFFYDLAKMLFAR